MCSCSTSRHRRSRRRGAAAARATELATATGVPDVAAELARRGLARVADLVAMGAALPDLSNSEPSTSEPAGGWLVDDARADQLAERLVTAVAEHEAASPLDPRMPVQAAQRALGLPDPALLTVLLRRDAAADLIVEAGRIRRSGSGSLPAQLRAALLALREELVANPFAAPTADRLRELGLGTRELATLVRAGELLRLADGIYLLPGADEAALNRLAELPSPFTLSAARQALDTSRRVVVPLLELLARRGLTTRTADGTHELCAAAKEKKPGRAG